MEITVSKDINIKLNLEVNVAEDITGTPETEKFYNMIHYCPDNTNTIKNFLYDSVNDKFYCNDCEIEFDRSEIMPILTAIKTYFTAELG